VPSKQPRWTRRGLLAASAASFTGIAGCQSSFQESRPAHPESLRVELSNQNGQRTTVGVVVEDHSEPVFEEVVTLRTSDDRALGTDLTGTRYDVEVATRPPDAKTWQRSARETWRWKGCREDAIVVGVAQDQFRVSNACTGGH